MPYKNIVWMKLEKRLLNDPRWFSLSEGGRLMFINMILMAAEFNNKIPKDPVFLKQVVKFNGNRKRFERLLLSVITAFPSIKESSEFYYFEGFEERTNQIRPPQKASPRLAQGYAGASLEKRREDKEKDKERPDSLACGKAVDNFLTLDQLIDESRKLKNLGYEQSKVKKHFESREINYDLITEAIKAVF